VLAVRLTALDLSRTVVRPTPSAMTELTAAGGRLMTPTPHDKLTIWKARTAAAVRPAMRPFLDLCALPMWMPDFLTPVGCGSGLDEQVDAVLGTPVARLRAELCPPLATGELPPRVAPLAAGDPDAVRRLGTAIRAFHAVAVEPYWIDMVTAVQSDWVARGMSIASDGIEHVLRTLSPWLNWDAPSLAYECSSGIDLTLDAADRGLVLQPSYLKLVPAYLDVPPEPVQIIYPIEHRPAPLIARTSLADLLGQTRAAVLGAVVVARNTTQVARVVGTSLGSVSQHTAVLRSAGLITTSRTGSSVLHAATPLGRSLLDAARTGF